MDDCDPTGQTEDGSIDLGGIILRDLDGVSAVEAHVTDDVFGDAVGGRLCEDHDDNNICGEPDKGEALLPFCETGGVLGVGLDTVSIGIFVNGSYGQAEHCDPTEAPTSTTGQICGVPEE